MSFLDNKDFGKFFVVGAIIVLLMYLVDLSFISQDIVPKFAFAFLVAMFVVYVLPKFFNRVQNIRPWNEKVDLHAFPRACLEIEALEKKYFKATGFRFSAQYFKGREIGVGKVQKDGLLEGMFLFNVFGEKPLLFSNLMNFERLQRLLGEATLTKVIDGHLNYDVVEKIRSDVNE